MAEMTRSFRYECRACGQSVWVDNGRLQKHAKDGKKCGGSGKMPGTEE